MISDEQPATDMASAISAYMTPENFMFHIKLYLGLKNDDIISVQWTIVYMGASYVFPYIISLIILGIQMYVIILYVYYMLCVYSGENKDYIIICICIPY